MKNKLFLISIFSILGTCCQIESSSKYEHLGEDYNLSYPTPNSFKPVGKMNNLIEIINVKDETNPSDTVNIKVNTPYGIVIVKGLKRYSASSLLYEALSVALEIPKDSFSLFWYDLASDGIIIPFLNTEKGIGAQFRDVRPEEESTEKMLKKNFGLHMKLLSEAASSMDMD